jgi:hypothetical protein
VMPVGLCMLGSITVRTSENTLSRTSENSIHAKFAEDTQDETRRSGLQVASRVTIIPDLVWMQAVTSVQQPEQIS